MIRVFPLDIKGAIIIKKILALIFVLCLFAALAACTQVHRISIEDPAKIMIDKQGGGMSVTLTDAKTVGHITDVICQIPLQKAESNGDDWSYRIQWLDESGKTITTVIIYGAQIRWEGRSYNLSIGVDLSVLTDLLESIPGLNP